MRTRVKIVETPLADARRRLATSGPACRRNRPAAPASPDAFPARWRLHEVLRLHGHLFPGRRPCQPTRAARGVLISSVLVGFLATPVSAWGVAIFIGSARLSVWVSSPLDLIFIIKIVKIFLSGRPARDGEKPDDLRYRGALRGRARPGMRAGVPGGLHPRGPLPAAANHSALPRCRQAGCRGGRHAIRRRASSAAVARPGALRQRGGSAAGCPASGRAPSAACPGVMGPAPALPHLFRFLLVDLM